MADHIINICLHDIRLRTLQRCMRNTPIQRTSAKNIAQNRVYHCPCVPITPATVNNFSGLENSQVGIMHIWITDHANYFKYGVYTNGEFVRDKLQFKIFHSNISFED